MKKKPNNDNLVMASIESLYNQANHSPSTDGTGLKRQNVNSLPIIGSLPVSISSDTAHQDNDHLDDMVLTGLLEAVAAEPDTPASLAKPDQDDNQQEDNPFLAIRQAVISAGQINPEQPENEPSSEQPANPAKQAFAGQLAELIDAEIERRLSERLNKETKPISAQTRAAKPKQPKQTSKTKQKLKSAAQSKAAKSEKTTPKKATKARRRPKS